MNIIETWPGGTNTKVPTLISIDQSGEVGSWGFLCERDSIHTKSLFKVFLDSTVLNSADPDHKKCSGSHPQCSTEVANWTYFYLRSLIAYAITSIGNTLRENAATDFQLLIHCVLTTPTTWDSNTVTTFGFIAERAICDSRQNQTYASSLKTIRVNITEPEAVANYIIHHRRAPVTLSHGDTFFVVDVGGATSDHCYCHVAEVYGHQICLVLNREASIQGISYGCMEIDQIFCVRVWERLKIANFPNPYSLAVQMGRGVDFQQHKTNYQQHDNTRSVGFPIPGCSRSTTYHQAQIFEGRIVL